MSNQGHVVLDSWNEDRSRSFTYRLQLRSRRRLISNSVTVWERDGRELVDMWTLRETKFEYSRAYRQAGIGRWIAFDDGRSNSKAALDATDDPRR
jgi:hypothetical protein